MTTRSQAWAALPKGPWSEEPNKVQWVDEATGFDALIVRNMMGALCGYVGVPPTHPLYGKDYDDQVLENVDVHGGLTYANPCMKDDPDGVCHVPEPGRPDDVWWFGFDCAHAWDVVPTMHGRGALEDSLFRVGNTLEAATTGHGMYDLTYRDIGYVKAECTSLAKQIKEMT
jgi:hypothetical protein